MDGAKAEKVAERRSGGSGEPDPPPRSRGDRVPPTPQLQRTLLPRCLHRTVCDVWSEPLPSPTVSVTM